MIKVTCQLEDYSSPTMPSIKVHNDWRTKRNVELEVDGKRYYFADDRYPSAPAGKMMTGWKTISGYRYYLGSNGVMRTGFQTINKAVYYFVDSSCAGYKESAKGRQVNGWRTIKGKKYYFIDSRCAGYKSANKGKMVTGFRTIIRVCTG